MRTFKLVIATPDGNMLEDEACILTLRGASGDLAVLAGHIPLVTSVKPCDCKAETEDGVEHMFRIDGGLLSVSAEKTVLLCGSCQKISEEK